ncbi:Cyclin, N-terminal domain protein [Cryptosporidium meleagridis]|uniref:Cyclin, N-terminal domain protein n=1 Tax=Cryptosporidium meleagridis TaxID=93969 RepID=A0A2P4YWS9_9CRYT|nr:Cyclin, N-terminal domain protein [Cryptosporidium meleagridis]
MYPSESHHLKEWVFGSLDLLKAKKNEINERAKENWKNEFRQISSENFEINELLLTSKDEETLISYYGRQLIEFCNHKQLPFVSKYNASILYNRFFTIQSVMDYDPRIIIFTSISLALKLEEFGLHFTLEKLFGDVPGLNIQEVFRHELTVCNTLKFHLYILNPRNTLEGLRLLYKKYYIDILVVDENLDNNDHKKTENKKNQLISLLSKVILKAETYVLAILHTLCFLIYTPSQISIALFDISARELNLPHSGEFLKKILKEIHQANSFQLNIETSHSSLTIIHSVRDFIMQTLENDRIARGRGYEHEEIETKRILDKLGKLQRRRNKEMKRRKKGS